MPTLYVLRHGKSSWKDESLEDHERGLAPRGVSASRVMAQYLSRAGVAPDLVLCSSALRARQTLELIHAGFKNRPVVLVEEALYHAGMDDVLHQLREVPDQPEAVMLVGHNPTLQELVVALAASGTKLERAREKFPTAALAILTFEGDWVDLGPGDARLRDFVRPKDNE
jgi:phosphohistidine phosphatase